MKKLYTFLLFLPFCAFSQNVVLDMDFGTAGIVHDFSKADVYCTVLTPQNGIISAGYQVNPIPLQGAYTMVVKYTADGDRDTAFGTNGSIQESIGFENIAYSIVQQPDGKIVVGGVFTEQQFSPYHAFLVRYNPDGTRDVSFGSNGLQKYSATDSPVPVPGFVTAIELLPNGQFLALVTSGQDALVRINPDGSVDTTFGVNGKVRLTTEAFDFQAIRMKLLHDGTIAVCGSDNTVDENNQLALIKLNPDGSYFTGFGTDGKVLYNFYDQENWEVFEGLKDFEELPDGSILLYGQGLMESLLIKLHPDGSFDNTFGTDGISVFDFISHRIAVQQDQKILLGGSQNIAANNTLYKFARFNPDGSLDTTFNSTGIFELNLTNGVDITRVINLQADGNLLVSGSSDFQGYAEFTHFRLLLDQNLSNPEFTDKDELQVFPNPFAKNIYFHSESTISEIVLNDLSGKKIFEAQPMANDYRLEIDLPAGMYLARITDVTGKVQAKKLIRQ